MAVPYSNEKRVTGFEQVSWPFMNTLSELKKIRCFSTLDYYDRVPVHYTYAIGKPCSRCKGIPCVNNLCMPDIRWLADGTGNAYDWTLHRALTEQHLTEEEIQEEEDYVGDVHFDDDSDQSSSIYPCFISLIISFGITLFA